MYSLTNIEPSPPVVARNPGMSGRLRPQVEKAQMTAAHESPRTTKLYDRTSDVVSLDEVERVVF
jgi:hypothetical protein